MPEEESRVVTVQEVEGLICQLPGVLAARVVVSDWGAIEEVHVLATAERAAKQVVRDVESGLMARWGLSVDHKRISVAQVVAKEPQPLSARLRLLGVQFSSDVVQGICQARVEVGLLDAEGQEPLWRSQGTAEGGASHLVLGYLLSEATVAALNQLVDQGWVFAVAGTTSVTVGGREVAVVLLTLLTPRGQEETLVGAALVRGERADAFVRACLDAANRRLVKICARRVRQSLAALEKGEGEADGNRFP